MFEAINPSVIPGTKLLLVLVNKQDLSNSIPLIAPNATRTFQVGWWWFVSTRNPIADQIIGVPDFPQNMTFTMIFAHSWGGLTNGWSLLKYSFVLLACNCIGLLIQIPSFWWLFHDYYVANLCWSPLKTSCFLLFSWQSNFSTNENAPKTHGF